MPVLIDSSVIPQDAPCLLALEASGSTCSVALLYQGRIRLLHGPATGAQSESLLGLTHTLLQEAGIEPKRLQGIAFSQGPGSFTGLRLACGIAQGLALALEVPLFPVSTLHAQVLACPAGVTYVLSTLDARMEQLYLGAYVWQDPLWICVLPPCLCHPRNPPPLPQGTASWTLIGAGMEAYAPVLSAAWKVPALPLLPGIRPDAGQLLVLACDDWAQGRGVAVEAAAPLYVRDKVALTRHERLR